MAQRLVRFIAAMAFVILLTAPSYATAGVLTVDIPSSSELYDMDQGALAYFVGISFAAGFMIGRWWAVLLLPLPVLASQPLGLIPWEIDGWTFALLLLVAGMLVVPPSLLFGLLTRAVVDRVRCRKPGGSPVSWRPFGS